MPFWCACRLRPRQENLALHCLSLSGFQTYYPKLRDRRIRFGRAVEHRPPLFPGYAFVLIQLQWHAARWVPGVIGLVMAGSQPAKIADEVIEEVRQREVNGLIELPKRSLRRGAQVKILQGPFRDHLAIFADMKPKQRIEVLLQFLGSAYRVELPASDVEAV
jgi:transcriptional antiterminator RfaH